MEKDLTLWICNRAGECDNRWCPHRRPHQRMIDVDAVGEETDWCESFLCNYLLHYKAIRGSDRRVACIPFDPTDKEHHHAEQQE